MTKPALRILCGHREQSLTKGLLERFTRASPSPTQMRLQFGKRFFNRGEVGRIAWQKEQLTSSRLNQVFDLLAFMSSQVRHAVLFVATCPSRTHDGNAQRPVGCQHLGGGGALGHQVRQVADRSDDVGRGRA